MKLSRISKASLMLKLLLVLVLSVFSCDQTFAQDCVPPQQTDLCEGFDRVQAAENLEELEGELNALEDAGKLLADETSDLRDEERAFIVKLFRIRKSN